VIPSGSMILVANDDKPGLIGKIGEVLGAANINIGGMNLGRQKIGGQALSIIEVDEKISPAVIEKLLKINGVKKAQYVAL